MATTTISRRWAAQTDFTRIAVSASIAFAVMLVLYLIITTSPSLVGMHAALYRLWETQARAWNAIATSALCFCIGMQLFVAYACAKARQKVDTEGNLILASEDIPAIGLFILWLFGIPLAFANFSPDYFTAKGADSWNVIGMVGFCQAVGLIAIVGPFMECKLSSTLNRVMWFAVGKWCPCLIYLVFSQSAVVVTLVAGTFLLDILLHPIGVPSAAKAGGEDAPIGEAARPGVQLSKDS